jgi:ABC-2 type transport system permease protein
MINFFDYCYTTVVQGLKCKIVYRLSAWLSSISGVVAFLIQVMIWRALLGNGARFGTTFDMMLTYAVLTQIANAFVSSFSGETISRLIKNGDIAIYLVRPIHLKRHLFLSDFGRNLFSVLLLNLPVCLVLILFWGITLSNNPMVIFVSIIMLINGIIILFHYRYILGLISFWLLKNPFTSWGFQNAESIFSGKVLPIWLCPVWLNELTRYLPFRYFTYEPVALFVGKENIADSWKLLLVQFCWMAFFIALERLISARAIRKLVVQGG